MKLRAVIAGFAFVLIQAATAAPEVRIVPVPEDGRVPDAEIGADGAIHLVWVKGDDVWYAKAGDGGTVFSAPERVNSEPGTAHPPNMFRGPDLALGREGRVHVVWYTNAFQRKRPKDEWGVAYARTAATGGGFTVARNLNHQPSDGYSLAADDRGNVAVLYMTGKLNVLASRDDGATFAPPIEVGEAEPCECCASRAGFGAEGLFVALYREKAGNVRDIFLLDGPLSGASFRRTRLSTVPWSINGCPMTGHSLTRTGTGFVAAWETKGRVSFARLAPTGKPTSAPEIEVAPRGKYPIALASHEGVVCVSWKEGSQIKWRLFDRENQPLGEIGSAPALSGDRHAAVVTRQDEFVLFP